jgi:hypothetical protein
MEYDRIHKTSEVLMAANIDEQRELIESLYAILLKSYGATEDELKKQALITKIIELDGGTPYSLYAQGVMAGYNGDSEANIKI